jgi:hypothetical protein
LGNRSSLTQKDRYPRVERRERAFKPDAEIDSEIKVRVESKGQAAQAEVSVVAVAGGCCSNEEHVADPPVLFCRHCVRRQVCLMTPSETQRRLTIHPCMRFRYISWMNLTRRSKKNKKDGGEEEGDYIKRIAFVKTSKMLFKEANSHLLSNLRVVDRDWLNRNKIRAVTSKISIKHEKTVLRYGARMGFKK